MRTVTLDICSREEQNRRLLAAFSGQEQGEYISFDSPALLFKVISGKRWELLQVLTGAGPVSMREAARRVGRDIKSIHGDIHTLLECGVLQRADGGKIVFPYDALHVDFLLNAA